MFLAFRTLNPTPRCLCTALRYHSPGPESFDKQIGFVLFLFSFLFFWIFLCVFFLVYLGEVVQGIDENHRAG